MKFRILQQPIGTLQIPLRDLQRVFKFAKLMRKIQNELRSQKRNASRSLPVSKRRPWQHRRQREAMHSSRYRWKVMATAVLVCNYKDLPSWFQTSGVRVGKNVACLIQCFLSFSIYSVKLTINGFKGATECNQYLGVRNFSGLRTD